MTGRIFQTLPTQTDSTVALIYKMICWVLYVPSNWDGAPLTEDRGRSEQYRELSHVTKL